MLNLDFAFFTMMENKRQGLAGWKLFLDSLAPVFLSPRVEKLIELGDLGFRGCNILLPMGIGNWTLLDGAKRSRMIEKSTELLEQYALNTMAVDRRLKDVLASDMRNDSFVYGDNFIKLLAAVLLDKAVSTKEITKLIIAGDLPGMSTFIRQISHYNIPISIQNYHPLRYENMIYRLLYEEGLAVSTSYINPHNWEEGNLLLCFDAIYRKMALASPNLFYIELSDECSGLAPEIENCLKKYGFKQQLQVLAPIMESCLYTKAGIIDLSGEEKNLEKEQDKGKNYDKLIKAGQDMGLWIPFLDKVI